MLFFRSVRDGAATGALSGNGAEFVRTGESNSKPRRDWFETLSVRGRPAFGDAESVLTGYKSGVARRAGGISEPSKFADGCGSSFFGTVCCRDFFTTARGTSSCPSRSSGSSSSILGSSGMVGARTHRFEEYLVLMKFSIFESDGICDGGN